MNQKDLFPSWGTECHTNLSCIRNEADAYRRLLYNRKLLVFRDLPPLSRSQLWDLHTIFGKPWTTDEYNCSLEFTEEDEPGKPITIYGNQTNKKIGQGSMPWHRDVSWHRDIRYPIRSLYPTCLENSAPESSTKFCDADVLKTRSDAQEWCDLLGTKLVIQNWYQAVHDQIPDTMEIPLIEVHPQTGKHSVLLSSFGPNRPDLSFSTSQHGTWVTDIKYADKSLGLDFLQQLHKVVCTPDNIYEHKWRLGDLVIFDNYSGVLHSRPKIVPIDSSLPVRRSFWRMNLRHSWQ